jgi:ATP-dependent DNA helicase RecG
VNDTPDESGRSLSYLTTVPVENVKGLAGTRGKALHKAGVTSVAHLLLQTPRRYVDRSKQVALSDIAVGEEVTVIGTVGSVRTKRPRRNLVIVEATIMDETGILTATWFNQGFRSRQLNEGQEVALSGKVERFRGKLQMKSPAVDVLSGSSESLTTGRVVPVHSSIGEVGPGYVRRAMHNALRRSSPLSDPIPVTLLDRRDLLDRTSSFWSIHFPDVLEEYVPARKRLVYDEFFRIQIALAKRRSDHERNSVGISHAPRGDLVKKFLAGLPFPLTDAQQRVIDETAASMGESYPMNRLLQGEVGSGKTVVAVCALLDAVDSGYQGAVMAPTEVLAGQHFLAISEMLGSAGLLSSSMGIGSELGMESLFGDSPGLAIALLTSQQSEVSGRGEAKRKKVLEWIASGGVDIVIGTHALIQEGVDFKRLSLAVVDEQHRFGVGQRVSLKEKAGDTGPDLLIMTATPIPRTLSMTLYGDLDASVLDEMPPGRSPVETTHVAQGDEESALELIRSEVAKGRQAFVVCPLVDESEKIEAASAISEHKRLSAVLPDFRVELLHGQMNSETKHAVMDRMRLGKIDVLVSTTVIEVGIDISNATVMVVENADRFGLSQLHQLRGRVGRGAHNSYCILMSDPTTPDSEQRIAAMVRTNDGFELAREDLRIRGQGTIFGSRQSGIGDLRLADILFDFDLLEAARGDAFEIIEQDPDLVDHPEIAEEVQAILGESVEWLFKS